MWWYLPLFTVIPSVKKKKVICRVVTVILIWLFDGGGGGTIKLTRGEIDWHQRSDVSQPKISPPHIRSPTGQFAHRHPIQRSMTTSH